MDQAGRSSAELVAELNRCGSLDQSYPWHLAEQGAFPAHDLIVRERRHKVFVERIDHTEGKLGVMKRGKTAPGRRYSSNCQSPLLPVWRVTTRSRLGLGK